MANNNLTSNSLASNMDRQLIRESLRPRPWVTNIEELFQNDDDLQMWLSLTDRRHFTSRDRIFPGLPRHVPFSNLPNTSRQPTAGEPSFLTINTSTGERSQVPISEILPNEYPNGWIQPQPAPPSTSYQPQPGTSNDRTTRLAYFPSCTNHPAPRFMTMAEYFRDDDSDEGAIQLPRFERARPEMVTRYNRQRGRVETIRLSDVLDSTSDSDSDQDFNSIMAEWAADMLRQPPVTPLRARSPVLHTSTDDYDFGNYANQRRRRLRSRQERIRARSPLHPLPTRQRLFSSDSEDEPVLHPPLARQNAMMSRPQNHTPSQRLIDVPAPPDWECTICMDDEPAGRPTVEHLCRIHVFHRDCLEQWMERDRRCPICRRDRSQ
jgi:hypothetical protein